MPLLSKPPLQGPEVATKAQETGYHRAKHNTAAQVHWKPSEVHHPMMSQETSQFLWHAIGTALIIARTRKENAEYSRFPAASTPDRSRCSSRFVCRQYFRIPSDAA